MTTTTWIVLGLGVTTIVVLLWCNRKGRKFLSDSADDFLDIAEDIID